MNKTPTPSTTTNTEEELSFWDEHRFTLLILGTIVIAMIFVAISIYMYKASGSALLDLSRPGYQSVSGKVDRADAITEYSAFGPVNKNTVNEFMRLYDQQAAKAKAIDAFNGDPLNPEVLEFSDPTVTSE